MLETTLSANLLETIWGASSSTLRSIALALCYSTAEYACPVWERSAHAKKIDPSINATCRLITWCLKSTPTNSIYILSSIAPPDIRRQAAENANDRLQMDAIHYSARYRRTNGWNLGEVFLTKTVPIGAHNTRVKLWEERRTNLPNSNLYVPKSKRGSSTWFSPELVWMEIPEPTKIRDRSLQSNAPEMGLHGQRWCNLCMWSWTINYETFTTMSFIRASVWW